MNISTSPPSYQYVSPMLGPLLGETDYDDLTSTLHNVLVQHNYGSHDAGTRMGQRQLSFLSIYLAGITPEVKYMRIERSGHSGIRTQMLHYAGGKAGYT